MIIIRKWEEENNDKRLGTKQLNYTNTTWGEPNKNFFFLRRRRNMTFDASPIASKKTVTAQDPPASVAPVCIPL